MSLYDEGAAQIGRNLMTTKATASSSVVDGANLLATMVEQFARSKVPTRMEQDTVEMAHAALGHAIQSRRSYVELHNRLAALARKLGVDPTAHGDTGTQPMYLGSEQPPLRAVA